MTDHRARVARAKILNDSERRQNMRDLDKAIEKLPWATPPGDTEPGSVTYRLSVNGKPVNSDGELDSSSYPHYAEFHGDGGLLAIVKVVEELRVKAAALGLSIPDDAIRVETQTTTHVRTSWQTFMVADLF